MAEPASTLAAGSVGTVETQYLDLPKPVRLDCGWELHPVRVAYETYGALSPQRDNVILVCHALSGDAHAAGFAKTPPESSTRDGFAAEDRDGSARRGLGWWDGMIGPGKAFDTDRFFVVSTNLLGGCRGTTGPSSIDPATGRPYGADFPVITVADMVRTERAFLDALGIERLAAVAGGSLGGMQAFEWAILFPDQVDAVVAIASTHALHPQGVAWNAIARDAIMRDPAWQGGHYYGTGRRPDAGMGVARMLGHVTYLSALALGDKFGRRLQFADDIRYTITEPEFEVESYLRHQADSFVRRFDANTYLYTSRALTYFDLARQYGSGSLARALGSVSARTLLIAFSSDWLYPPSASREIADALHALGKPAEFHVIEAPYGHDCFLLEEARQTPIIRQFVSQQSGGGPPSGGGRGARGREKRSAGAGEAERGGGRGGARGREKHSLAEGGAGAKARPAGDDEEEAFVTDKPTRAEQARAFGFETRQLHAGQRPDPNTGARAVPIFQTTSYVFEDPESAAAYFNLQEYGNTYSRIMNPTVAVFEERVANLEGGCGAVAFASGIAAQAAALFTMLQPGDHVVSSSALYGGTVNQFKHLLRKMSVELTWVHPDDLDAWRRAVRPNTKAFFGETIGNPAGNVLDIETLASIAHDHELPLIVDNTFATPYLCRPIEWGADIVIHSATKFIGGHGTSIGGVVVEAGTFNWSNGRFPVVADPSPAYHGLQFHETFGTYGYLMKLRAETLRDLGAALSPFSAFLFLQGLETLSLRMERHVGNALGVAAFLQAHELASNVTYPGLPSSGYRPLVEKYLPRGAGAVFSFDCAGGRAGGQNFIGGLTLWSHLANVGDAKSLVIHPASTTHRQLSEDELRAAGVGPGTVRLSVGTESVDDLIWDLEQGFARVAATVGKKVATA